MPPTVQDRFVDAGFGSVKRTAFEGREADSGNLACIEPRAEALVGVSVGWESVWVGINSFRGNRDEARVCGIGSPQLHARQTPLAGQCAFCRLS